MAITEVQSVSADGTSGGQVTATLASNVTSGNLILAIVGTSADASTIGAPSGWSPSSHLAANSCGIAAFYKKSNGTEGNAFVFTKTGSLSLHITARVWELAGQDSHSGVGADAVAAASGLTASCGTVFPNNDCAAFAGVVYFGASATWQNAWTNGFAQDGSITAHMEWASLLSVAGGSTVTTAETISASRAMCGLVLIVTSAPVALDPVCMVI